jgi:D-Tyr-tRNAtyr deacylase
MSWQLVCVTHQQSFKDLLKFVRMVLKFRIFSEEEVKNPANSLKIFSRTQSATGEQETVVTDISLIMLPRVRRYEKSQFQC